jgi:hypothetical protein
MTEEQIALAKRVVACRCWRFMGGMLVADAIGKQRVYDDVAGEPYWSADGWLPDLTDPATLGCLLALVREAWGDECTCVLPVDYGPGGVMWVCQLTAGGRSLTNRHWATEAEALVNSLEAAP